MTFNPIDKVIELYDNKFNKIFEDKLNFQYTPSTVIYSKEINGYLYLLFDERVSGNNRNLLIKKYKWVV